MTVKDIGDVLRPIILTYSSHVITKTIIHRITASSVTPIQSTSIFLYVLYENNVVLYCRQIKI